MDKLPHPVSIVIPTCGRDQVLVETIEGLLGLDKPAAEILVIDQSSSHKPGVEDKLDNWCSQGRIRLVKLEAPSIPHAMNTGLEMATNERVLFLDDDIYPHAGLVEAHVNAQTQNPGLLVAGKVIQPWDETGVLDDAGHSFNSGEPKPVSHFMGGNFSVPKTRAIELGGFDENFIGVAYRFEKEFADRWIGAGQLIMFEPKAAIDHLKAETGGTRQYGEHLTTARPEHAVGAYYYYLTSPNVGNKATEITRRLLSSIKTRHHLKKPWYIPVTLLAETRGLIKAKSLSRKGPRLIC